MKKQCKIVMLPTDKIDCGNNLAIATDHPYNPLSPVYKGSLNIVESNIVNNGGWQLQHLYIVSDDDIKLGDYYYHDGFNEIFRGSGFQDDDHKVIASTENLNDVPSIPQLFIDIFITEYNKGNIITNVEVEYSSDAIYSEDNYPNTCVCCGTQFNNTICPKCIFPLINPDNTITIYVPKTTWTREEVIALIRMYHAEFASNPIIMTAARDQWIEDNL